jgi:hypothetical protein
MKLTSTHIKIFITNIQIRYRYITKIDFSILCHIILLILIRVSHILYHSIKTEEEVFYRFDSSKWLRCNVLKKIAAIYEFKYMNAMTAEKCIFKYGKQCKHYLSVYIAFHLHTCIYILFWWISKDTLFPSSLYFWAIEGSHITNSYKRPLKDRQRQRITMLKEVK